MVLGLACGSETSSTAPTAELQVVASRTGASETVESSTGESQAIQPPAVDVPLSASAETTQTLTLRASEPFRQQIPAGEAHLYQFDLAQDDFLRLDVAQLQGDVYLELLEPSGRLLSRVDSAADATPDRTSLLHRGGNR